MYVVDPIKCYLIGGPAIAISLFAHSKKKKRLKLWIPVAGSVEDIRRDRDDETTAYVRFSDQSGKLCTAKVKVADGDRVGLGSSLEISYNPQRPEEAFVRSARDMNLALYVPLVGGILVLIMGIFSQVMLSRSGLGP